MTWSQTIFCASVALVLTAAIKYGTRFLIARVERKLFMEAMQKVIKEDMHDKVLERIDRAVSDTLTQTIYSGKNISVYDKEGNLVGFIRRATLIETPGTQDYKKFNADR